jgi:hypothetical protein
MFNVNRLLVVLRAGEETHAIVNFLDPHQRIASYRGEILRLADLPRLIDVLHVEYLRILHEEVYQGLEDHPDLKLDYEIEDLVDDVRSRAPHYSFLDDPRNPFVNARDSFLKLVLTHPRFAGRYHYVHEGQVHWYPAQCIQLLKAITNALAILLVMTHISNGGVARLNELLTHLLRNIPGANTRNTMLLQRCFCLVGGYTKTSRRHKRDKVIPRAPPMFIGRLWINHLALLRGFEVEIVRYLMGDEHATRYRVYLCPKLTRNMQPEDVTSVLETYSHNVCDIRLTVSSWRQLQNAFSHAHRDPDLVEEKKQ